ncbi:hypothetical protein YC2023_089281 [Brassica napus]
MIVTILMNGKRRKGSRNGGEEEEGGKIEVWRKGSRNGERDRERPGKGGEERNRHRRKLYYFDGMFTKEENLYARMSMYGKRLAYDYTIFNIGFYPNKPNKIKHRGNQQLDTVGKGKEITSSGGGGRRENSRDGGNNGGRGDGGEEENMWCPRLLSRVFHHMVLIFHSFKDQVVRVIVIQKTLIEHAVNLRQVKAVLEEVL